MSKPAETRRVVPAHPGDGIRADIANTRAELGNALDMLVERLDVKQRAKRKLAANRAAMRDGVHRAKQAVPKQTQQALERVGDVVSPALQKARPYRVWIALVAGGVIVATVYVLRRQTRVGELVAVSPSI